VTRAVIEEMRALAEMSLQGDFKRVRLRASAPPVKYCAHMEMAYAGLAGTFFAMSFCFDSAGCFGSLPLSTPRVQP
jgi:hypothetical protein